jgi:hypothetical protein
LDPAEDHACRIFERHQIVRFGRVHLKLEKYRPDKIRSEDRYGLLEIGCVQQSKNFAKRVSNTTIHLERFTIGMKAAHDALIGVQVQLEPAFGVIDKAGKLRW